MADQQFAPDAFTVRPNANPPGWAVIGPRGTIESVLPDEGRARRWADSLKRQWGQVNAPGAAPASTPMPPSPATPPPPAAVSVPPPPVPRPTTQAAVPVPVPVPVPPPMAAATPPPQHTPLSAFPTAMQFAALPPPPPRPPAPPPTRVQQFARSFRQAYPATSAFMGHASVRGAASAAFAAAAPEVAIPLALAGEAKRVIESAIKAMREFAERTTDANKSLVQYNGQVALAYQRLAISEFGRNVNIAGRTATGSEALVKAVDRMRDTFLESRVFQQNVSNMTGIFVARIEENIGRALAPFAAKGNELLGRDQEGGAAKLLADVITTPINNLSDAIKALAEFLGVQFPAARKGGGVQQGPWDNLVRDIIKGQVGRPILPRAGRIQFLGAPLGGAPLGGRIRGI